MIETIAWRACINIDVNFKTKNYALRHIIAEDTGIVLGRALSKLFQSKMKKGTKGAGYSVSILDEAMAIGAISIEGRSNSFIDLNGKKAYLRNVEDCKGADLIAFIEGLAQGMNSTIQVKILKGYDPHHIWEAIFRAIGESIRDCFTENSWRKNTIAGVKGILK
jgi:imidazoleglycerol phosphate dehydratase HisB